MSAKLYSLNIIIAMEAARWFVPWALPLWAVWQQPCRPRPPGSSSCRTSRALKVNKRTIHTRGTAAAAAAAALLSVLCGTPLSDVTLQDYHRQLQKCYCELKWRNWATVSISRSGERYRLMSITLLRLSLRWPMSLRVYFWLQPRKHELLSMAR